jgi:hypothetical protein
MQREPFAKIVLSDDAAREQDDGAVNPHCQRFAHRNAPLWSAFGEVGKWTMTRQKGDDADEQDDRKRPIELLSTSVMGGVVASSGRSSGTPFLQNRTAAALSRHQITKAIQMLG